MSPVPTRRYRIRRAIERGDPRLGLVVGVLLAALSATAFVRRDWVGVAETLELKALDFAFKQRRPIEESEKIVLVDIDDRTLRKLQWPIPRQDYARAILALDRLGAAQIVFDVEFSTVIPRQGDYDEESGEHRLREGEAALPFAIGKSGKVTLAYHFDLKQPLPERLGPYLQKLKKVFAANIGADAAEVVGRSGVPREWVAESLESIRESLVPALIAEDLDAHPGMSFIELRNKYLPNYDSRVQGADLNLLQFGWQQWRSGRAMELKAPVAKVEGLPPRPRQGYAVVPPLYPFLEHARGVATANAEPDAQDGVMRRPWSHLVFQGKSYPYLGLQAGAQALAGPGGSAETIVHPDRVEIVAHPVQGEDRRTSVPVDREGQILVNWAGNSRRNRTSESSYFSHIPFLQFVEFYNTRYPILDENVRQTLKQLIEDERQVIQADEYLKLSDRLNEALRGRGGLTFEKARTTEARLDVLRKAMVEAFRQNAAEIEKSLKTMTSPRARQNAEKERANRLRIAEEIEAPYKEEQRLRPLVEGKLCLVGSASTGSGDLHATPLGSSVPGMDVLANVANMVLTKQVIRRAPNWINFAYLFGVGLLVSYYVTHSTATWSSVATGATMAVTGGLFWWCFTGPAILITGAGPVVTALLTFGGVTTYKELLTQRSKRKLQRELEKNTSPELVKILMEHPEWLSEPRRMTGTFFFSDVKSFTSISEKMNADILFPFINRYLDRQTHALKAHQAFVDKYIGDGIMALFGIPVPTPDHARNACRAALDCQAALKPLNAENELKGLPKIKARIGIHSGEVSAGAVGALDRSNYTVLGDNVNLAARLEGANKEYDTSIMISEATWALVAGKFQVRELDLIRVVGKKVAVRIFELIAAVGQPLPFDGTFLDVYGRALEDFKGRRWAEAIQGFQKAMELKPGDVPSKTYIERAKVFQIMPPPPDWEGVFELTSK